MIRRALIFVAALCLAAVTAWIGGYDFDTRNFWTGYFFAISVGLAAFITHLAGEPHE